MRDYTADLDLFVRRVKFAICALDREYLDGLHYCCADEQKYKLSHLLLSSLQVLSYLRECDGQVKNKQSIKLVVDHVLTLIDLQDVELEPYNLYLRRTKTCGGPAVLWDGELPVGDGESYLQVGGGILSRSLTLPTVYEQESAPTLTTLVP